MDYTLQKDLYTILESIKSRVRLERLYLFGSFAYGQPTPDSDLDLCIIAKTDQSKMEALRDIRTSLFARTEYPLDFVFFSPDEFKTRSQVRNSFEWQIEHKGQMIYGQP